MLSISYIIATFFGSGRLPYAPGTWGTIAGLIIAFIGYFYHLSAQAYLLIAGILFFIGWITSEHILKSTEYQDTDPSFIVIDEVVGLFVTIGLLGLYKPLTPDLLFISFFVFRLFDIFKPWPICWIDEILAKSTKTAALGIMTDDVLAGIMAVFCVLIIHYFTSF